MRFGEGFGVRGLPSAILVSKSWCLKWSGIKFLGVAAFLLFFHIGCCSGRVATGFRLPSGVASNAMVSSFLVRFFGGFFSRVFGSATRFVGLLVFLDYCFLEQL